MVIGQLFEFKHVLLENNKTFHIYYFEKINIINTFGCKKCKTYKISKILYSN
jgi:hypothetical protein